MNIYRFKKIFYSLISKKDTKKLLKILESLYNDNILNEELILNFTRAFVIIFYLDKNNFNKYYILLKFLKNNNKFCIKLFKLIKKINFSLQIKLNQKKIDKIIIITNYYFLNMNKNNTFEQFKLFYDIIEFLINLNASSNYKINLYLFLIKYSINKINIKKEFDDIKIIFNELLND